MERDRLTDEPLSVKRTCKVCKCSYEELADEDGGCPNCALSANEAFDNKISGLFALCRLEIKCDGCPCPAWCDDTCEIYSCRTAADKAIQQLGQTATGEDFHKAYEAAKEN